MANKVAGTNGNGKLPAIVSASLLSCDLANIARDAQQMLDMGVQWLHMDVMDGHFVPNLSFGPPVLASLRGAHREAFIDVHLMVTDPMKWVTPMAKAGIDSFTFHIEAKMPENGGIEELISALRAEKMQVGIALKPATPASAIAKYAHLIDLILVMTVEPGFSGQKFMSDMMPKVKELRTLYPSKHITVDGGLGPNTVDQATEVGANVIVSASAIFGSENREDVIKQLQASAENGLKNLAI